MNEASRGVFSILGVFDSAQLLMNAIPKVREAVTGRLEAYTPYPIHGIDKALGLRKSPIGGMVFVMGLIGAVSAIGFELWTSGWDYPQITAGKPYFSWEAFVPVMFEATVLLATFAAGLGMLFLLNRLPMFRHPMLRSSSMPLLTRDKFGLAIESTDADLDVESAAAILRDAGAETVEIIEKPEPTGPASPKFLGAVLMLIGIVALAAGYLTYWGIKLFPTAIPMVHMLNQPRLDPQRSDDFFTDGFGMRTPVPGTVVRGFLPYTIRDQDDAIILENPLPRTDGILKQGRQAFITYCSVCHGLLGNGMPSLTAAYGAKPANLVSKNAMDLADGVIYHIIMVGKNAMPAHAADLNENERWAAVHYVRVMQRAMNAKDSDFK